MCARWPCDWFQKDRAWCHHHGRIVPLRKQHHTHNVRALALWLDLKGQSVVSLQGRNVPLRRQHHTHTVRALALWLIPWGQRVERVERVERLKGQRLKEQSVITMDSSYDKDYSVSAHVCVYVFVCMCVCVCVCITHMYRAGQNREYSVYIRYIYQGNHQIYGHMRCVYTVLANLTHVSDAHTHAHTHIHTRIHTHTRTHTHAHTHTHTHTLAHTHAHTHRASAGPRVRHEKRWCCKWKWR